MAQTWRPEPADFHKCGCAAATKKYLPRGTELLKAVTIIDRLVLTSLHFLPKTCLSWNPDTTGQLSSVNLHITNMQPYLPD